MAHLKALGSDDVDKAAIYSHDEESVYLLIRVISMIRSQKVGLNPKMSSINGRQYHRIDPNGIDIVTLF